MFFFVIEILYIIWYWLRKYLSENCLDFEFMISVSLLDFHTVSFNKIKFMNFQL